MTQSSRGGDRAALACATIIRNRTLTAIFGPPSAAVIQQMVDEIHASCPQQSRFKCRRLAHGWTVEEGIDHFHAMCDREHVKRRGLTERSWREWEAGARPDRDYTDLLCRLFETGPVQLGFANDYTPEELRSVWTYGKVSGHMALMGWARGMQSSVALWDRRYSDAVRYAEDGLDCLRVGSGAARLHMLRARSYALLGRAEEASEALLQAADVRTGADELHDEIAGEFAFRPAKEHYYAAVTYLHLSDPASAIESARRSLSLYASGEPENRSYGCESMASAHLAIAHLMEGDRQGAEDALAPILALPPDRRIGSLSTTLSTGRSLLSTRPGGEQLARQIENFCSVGLPQQARRAISDGSRR